MSDEPRERAHREEPRPPTPKTDPDTGAGHRPSRAQPVRHDEPIAHPAEPAPPAAPNERERPPVDR